MATETLSGFSPAGYNGFRDPNSRSESGDQITIRLAIAHSAQPLHRRVLATHGGTSPPASIVLAVHN